MTKSVEATVASLSFAQCEYLLFHVDHAVAVQRSNFKTLPSLLRLGLIQSDVPNCPRPRYTILTDFGRQAVCMLLANYADALVRAGCLDAEPLSTLAILQRLKAAHKPPVSAQTALEPARIALSGLEK